MLTNIVHIQYTLKKAAWFYTQPNDSKVWWESGKICSVNTQKTLESNEQNENERQKICALQSYDQVFFLRSMSVVPVQALIVSSSCALKGGVMNKIYIDDVWTSSNLSPSGYWVQETDMSALEHQASSSSSSHYRRLSFVARSHLPFNRLWPSPLYPAVEHCMPLPQKSERHVGTVADCFQETPEDSWRR